MLIEINLKKKTKHFHFTQSGKEKIADLLIGNKADVNIKNKEGDTPLHWAAKLGES